MPRANSTEKEQYVKEFDELRSQRGTFEEHWRKAAEVGSPRDNIFNQQDVTQGIQVRNRQYDEAAELALDKSAAFFGSVTTPQNDKWHTVRTSNEELNKVQGVREFLDSTTETLFKTRYAPRANYASTIYESDRSAIGFGTGIWFNGAGTGAPSTRVPLWYRPIHLSECFISENAFGFPDKLFRRNRRTGRQIIKEYGEDNISSSVLKQMQDRPETLHEVIAGVVPNPDFDPDPDNFTESRFRYLSRVWLHGTDDDFWLADGGYRTWPYSIYRDSKRPTECYGRGTLMKVLPAILMRNQMKRTQIRVGHQFSDPTLLVKDDSSIDMKDIRPGVKVSGGIAADGSSNIVPFQSGANWEISQDFLNDVGEVIKEAFGLNLFMADLDTTGRERVTATEIRFRDQERSRLLTPLASRKETEGLQPQIERELDILRELFLIPELPPEMIEAGGEYQIQFVDPLSVSRRADEAIGAVQTVETILAAAAIQPIVLDTINWDEYGPIVAEANSSPSKLLNSKEEIAEIRQARAEEEALAQAAQAAPGVGRGIKDVAQAEQIAEGATAG